MFVDKSHFRKEAMMNRSTGTWQWNFKQSASTIDRIPVVSAECWDIAARSFRWSSPPRSFRTKGLFRMFMAPTAGLFSAGAFGGPSDDIDWNVRECLHRLQLHVTCGFSISDLCQSMANPCQRYLMLSDIDRCVSIAGQISATVISDAYHILFRNPTSHPTTSSNR